jgi:hypothetical protein
MKGGLEMRKCVRISLVVLAAIVMMVAVASAKPFDYPIRKMYGPGPVSGVNPLDVNTYWYGGTVVIGNVPYAAAPTGSGWANRGMWTWSPAGYSVPHSGLPMDGWVGVDNTVPPEDYFHVAGTDTMGAACVIDGTKSLFCSATNTQCIALCYVDQNGTGYGNNWKQTVVTKTYTYNPGDQITLSYYYHNESEDGYDSTYVILQIYDAVEGWVDHTPLGAHTGSIPLGMESIGVDTYMLGVASVDFRIKFSFRSDRSYSDQDNLCPTNCGAFILDNYDLDINGTHDSEDFESVAVGALPAGWQRIVEGCADYAKVKHLDDLLPIPLAEDLCVGQTYTQWCGIADSVLVFYDEATPDYPHPLCQDNYAISPIIDFSAYPNMPGRILHAEAFASLPLDDHVFMYWQVRYKPGCPSGEWSPWLSDNYVYYTDSQPRCYPFSFDISTYVPPTATRAQVGLGVVNLCERNPWDLECSDECNETPYFDNVCFGVYGTDDRPYISMSEVDYWQDQFAQDGTLEKTSTADTRTARDLAWLTPSPTTPLEPPVFGDTLVCQSAAPYEVTVREIEVDLVFRMAKHSPLIWQHLTDPFFTTWFPTVLTGAWQVARMDTAKVTDCYGTKIPIYGKWMSCFHVEDPIRIAMGLPEGTEILPNDLFVPGTEIQYYLKAKYAGSNDWFHLPNNAPDSYYTFRVLPMYRQHPNAWAGVVWPGLIVADHFGGLGNWGEFWWWGWQYGGTAGGFETNADRIGRHLTDAGYEYDIYRKLAPTSGMRNGIGRWWAAPGSPQGPGATFVQFLAYTHCMMNTGYVFRNSIEERDVNMINIWLGLYSPPGRFFWLSGDQVARELDSHAPWGSQLLNNTLCAIYPSLNYPEVPPPDYTYCLLVNAVSSGPFVQVPYVARMNGCPRMFNVIGVSGAAGCNAAAQREYDLRAPTRYAAVSNEVNVMPTYKTFMEGYDHCLIRSDDYLGFPDCGGSGKALANGNHNVPGDGNDSILTDWLASVLSWGGLVPPGLVDSSMVSVNPDAAVASALVSWLAQAYPNPMNPTATIKYTVGAPGRVTLRVFDVTGRVIRTLVDETKATGAYSVIWDGTNDRGERIPSGVFFYQYEAPGYKSAKKLVILK